MKNPRLLTTLTLLNLGLLAVTLVSRIIPAQASGTAPVMRARMLEIVDDQGRVRASIKVQPAEVFKPTGKHYGETVVFRLIDAKGRPEVKIAGSEEGGGLSFVGATDKTQVKLGAMGSNSSLMLLNEDGRQEVVKP